MSENLGFQPVILLGAARSGTNMLRDIVCRLSGIGTWPCDEINYIWRYGNARFPSDELTPTQATPNVRNYIRNSFEKLARKNQLSHVIEKTCANTLRVAFVNTVLPEAKYIHLIRDGRDAAISAAERWVAALDLRYIAQKAFFVPIADLPYYAAKYLANRLRKLVSRDKRLSAWGPRFEGLDEILRNKPLHIACALQWQQCVTRAEEELRVLDESRVCRIRYEDFVRSPEHELAQLLDKLEIPAGNQNIAELTASVRSGSVGRWREKINDDIQLQMGSAIGNTLKAYGYDC